MNMKEFAKDTLDNFFIIFTCTILGMTVYFNIFEATSMLLSDIVAVFIMSVFISLAGIILYSKREPKRLEMLVRHAIHLLVVTGIALTMGSYLGWVFWDSPITVIRFLGLVVGVYVSAHAITFYQSKKLTDKLNEKQKERYKR